MLSRISEFLRPGLRPDVRLYFAAVPLALLSSVSTHSMGSSAEITGRYLLANLLSFVVVGLGFYLGGKVLNPKGRFVISQLFAFGLLLGFLKQVSTSYLVWSMALEESVLDAIATRAVTPFLGAWTVLALAGVTSAQAHFEKLRESLIAERVRQRSVEQGEKSKELLGFVNEANRLLAQSEKLEATELAHLIREIVQNKLRPLTHELWDKEQASTPGFGSKELVRKALRSRPYKTAWTVLIFSLGIAYPTIIHAQERWLLALVAWSAPATVALLVANLTRRQNQFAKDSYLLTLVATSAFAGAAGGLVSALLELPATAMTALTTSWWLGTIVVLVGTFFVAIEDHSKQKELLAKLVGNELEEAAMSALRTIRNREMASSLHSKTQNRLLTQALRIESGRDVHEELLALREMIESLPQQNFAEPTLEELRNRWDGLLEVTWRLEVEPTSLQLRIIEEGLANAFRHGHATKVQISLTGDQLTLSDNGLGPTLGKPGLGSSLFSSSGRWNLVPLPDGGSELRVSF